MTESKRDSLKRAGCRLLRIPHHSASKQSKVSVSEERTSLSTDAARLRDQFLKLAVVLEMYAARVNIVSVAGGGVEVYGQAVTVAGYLLAPFTEGTSLFLTAIGKVISTVGHATSGGAKVFGSVIEVHELRRIEELWDEFRKKYAGVVNLNIPDEVIEKEGKKLFGAGKLAIDMVRRIKSLLENLRHGAQTRYWLRGKATGGSVIGFAFSAKEFIDATVKIHGDKSKAGQALRELANELDQIAKMNI